MSGIWVAAFPQASQGQSYDLQDGLGGLVARIPPCIQAGDRHPELATQLGKLNEKNSRVDWFILPCTGPRGAMECLGLRQALLPVGQNEKWFWQALPPLLHNFAKNSLLAIHGV